jgi:hypothetical protein
VDAVSRRFRTGESNYCSPEVWFWEVSRGQLTGYEQSGTWASGLHVRDWQNLILVNQAGLRFYDETVDQITANNYNSIVPYAQGSYRNLETVKYNPHRLNFINAALGYTKNSELVCEQSDTLQRHEILLFYYFALLLTSYSAGYNWHRLEP